MQSIRSALKGSYAIEVDKYGGASLSLIGTTSYQREITGDCAKLANYQIIIKNLIVLSTRKAQQNY